MEKGFLAGLCNIKFPRSIGYFSTAKFKLIFICIVGAENGE
jgi:hypothetical protein